MADDEKIVRIDEKIIEKKLIKQARSSFKMLDDYIEAQADHLIEIAKKDMSISEFCKMRPINPSVVHFIILKLLGRT